MPFTYHNKPKLADRFRGKSGEEILNELKSELNPGNRRMFESPSWRLRHNNPSGFSRGFPFVDDRNRSDVRTYLDEIAARHPEFADQLKEPPWDDDFCNSYLDRERKGSNSNKKENFEEEAGSSTQNTTKINENKKNLTNYGLRNTVPLGPGSFPEERHQRSMSAPPDSRIGEKPKRFVSTCEIPVMHDPNQESGSLKSNVTGKGAENAQQKLNNSPNVRVIPIQVEGRDAPLVNTNIDSATNFGSEAFRDNSFEGRLPRDFGTYQRHSPRFAHKERAPTPPQQYANLYQQYIPPQQHFTPSQHQFMPQQQFGAPSHQQSQQHSFANQKPHLSKQTAATQQQHPQQQYSQQQHPQAPPSGKQAHHDDEVDSKPPPQPKAEPPKDPIEKVQIIQKEVEELMKQVESFKGNSRSDKQYLMLDELLTRQLLLLDNIDTEGKENVRQARKDTIRSIQRCISTLENKVPLLENDSTPEPREVDAEKPNEGSDAAAPQPMDVDKTKENTPVEGKESHAMEVDDKGNKEPSQQPAEEEAKPKDSV